MERVAAQVVVVGVDGSLGGARALDVAIAEARLRKLPLRLVHALQWPVYTAVTAVESFEAERPAARENARQMLAEQCAYARNAAPDLKVESRYLESGAAAGLIAESAQAGLTVVGRRGLGGFSGLLLGSVSAQVSAHATSPVMVVPATGMAPDGPVLVGVDGLPAAQRALAFAFQEAALHSAPLTVVHAYTAPRPAKELPESVATQEHMLSQAVAGWLKRYPDLTVTQHLELGTASSLLLSRAADARMVVVGSRGRGGFLELLLGSTSQVLLHHAPCPIVVVPEQGE